MFNIFQATFFVVVVIFFVINIRGKENTGQLELPERSYLTTIIHGLPASLAVTFINEHPEKAHEDR